MLLQFLFLFIIFSSTLAQGEFIFFNFRAEITCVSVTKTFVRPIIAISSLLNCVQRCRIRIVSTINVMKYCLISCLYFGVNYTKSYKACATQFAILAGLFEYLTLSMEIEKINFSEQTFRKISVGLMHRSIRNFDITPRAYPGHLTVHHAWGGGNLNVALEGWGI